MGMCANLDVELALSATYFKREKRDLESVLESLVSKQPPFRVEFTKRLHLRTPWSKQC